jgi:hypothetical protein
MKPIRPNVLMLCERAGKHKACSRCNHSTPHKKTFFCDGSSCNVARKKMVCNRMKETKT